MSIHKCFYCKKILTNDELKSISNEYSHIYSADIDDKICDKCEAHGRARLCANCITADMFKYREQAKKNKIKSPYDFLTSKLERIKKYWIKYHTSHIEMPKYKYWMSEFENEVENLTYNLVFIEQEKTKSSKIDY